MNEQKYAAKAHYRVVIAAPIDTVWSELLKTTSPRPFFWNSTWDTPGFEPGNPYRVTSNQGKAVAVIGKILEIDPPRRLVTSFRLTNLPDPPSIMIYELESVEGGTQFTLTTDHVLAGSKSEKSMADGSRFIVKNFKAFVETGKVTFGARVLLGFFALMAPFTPKVMRVEQWPLENAE